MRGDCMANVKTYKMEPETSEKLQKICEELNLTWDGTFQTLANLYMQQKAIGALPERGMEVKEFQSLLNRVSEAFTYALTVNADAEERIRQEFTKKFLLWNRAFAYAHLLKRKLHNFTNYQQVWQWMNAHGGCIISYCELSYMYHC